MPKMKGGEVVAVKYITESEAVEQIKAIGEMLIADMAEREAIYTLYIKKLVYDVLEYCHRDDFPEGLIYTCGELLAKRASDDSSETKNLKSVKMDDTEFQFATATQTAGTQADADFATIKSKLNLYRKIGGWNN